MNYLPLFMKLSKNRITDCYEHQWASYNKAQVLCFEDDKLNSSFHLSIAYLPADMEYVALEVKDWSSSTRYILANPKFASAISDDYIRHEVDDEKFIFLEVLEDFVEKASAIISRKPYDKNILIELDLPESDIEALTQQSENLGKTLNDYLVEVIMANAHNALGAKPHSALIADDTVRVA